MTNPNELAQQLLALDATSPDYATQFVDRILKASTEAAVSDVHLQPIRDGLELRWRLDGVLQEIGVFPSGDSADVVTRLKVLAGLLTYRVDLPQEGRIHEKVGQIEMRVSTFPTLFGERAVIRLFVSEHPFVFVKDLGLSDQVEGQTRRLLMETSGVLIVAGPSGSGKTTTAYACLRELVRISGGGRSIVSIEDPIEVAVNGVAQSQVNAGSGFNLSSGLRSLMRQDPEVILLGEIRDRGTAETVFQAALTGHLVLTTFHAGSAATAISRLADMGIEPYLLRSGLLGIVSQRLLRGLCSCSRRIENEEGRLGLPIQNARQAVGCSACRQTGYSGRFVLAEILQTDQTELGRAILSRDDASVLEELATRSGMTPNRQLAIEAVEQGRTSPAELRRVFGFAF